MVILKMEWRGVEQWKLVGLITRRSLVRIQPPLPNFEAKMIPKLINITGVIFIFANELLTKIFNSLIFSFAVKQFIEAFSGGLLESRGNVAIGIKGYLYAGVP